MKITDEPESEDTITVSPSKKQEQTSQFNNNLDDNSNNNNISKLPNCNNKIDTKNSRYNNVISSNDQLYEESPGPRRFRAEKHKN